MLPDIQSGTDNKRAVYCLFGGFECMDLGPGPALVLLGASGDLPA
jgi:hypothetical protein